MTEKKLKKIRRWFRSAITGQFVKPSEDKRHPKTTVEESSSGEDR